MLQLKEYQQRSLEILKAYFRACISIDSVDTAFYHITQQVYKQGIPYRPVVGLPGLPYVCLRVPTGGGKTLMACHTIGLTSKEFIHGDHIVVLWLVPSNTIREQTLNALKDHKHSYRQAIEAENGSINVLDIREALSVTPSILNGGTTIIVSTMQAFRVEDTEGRKVYDESGDLMGHFTGKPDDALEDLEQHENGEPVHSLANVLRLHRPLVIVDEAHNARTSLSFETLARFNPSCIIEFTATPDTKENPSNVLHSVSAAELKAEDMIKMPIRLETLAQWKALLSDAVTTLKGLEDIAKKERKVSGEYIRPIMLLQAQPTYKDKETITVDVVEQTLKSDFNISADQIARATGSDRELEGVDLFEPSCNIRYIITIQALREGWDCPWAYVLCTVAELRSSTAVEQILGRILRLPKTKRKQHPELNLAYAFSASRNFAEVANELADALVQNGFEKQEAEDLILPFKPEQPDLGPLFNYLDEPTETVTLNVSEVRNIENLHPEVASKIQYDPERNTITIKRVLEDKELYEVRSCFTSVESQKAFEQANQKLRLSKRGTPSEQGEIFSVPVLAIKQDDFIDQFEETHFLDHPWKLSKCDVTLSKEEYSPQQFQGQEGIIDISSSGRVQTQFLSHLHRQMELLSTDQGWMVADLAYWLDRNFPHVDITPEESGIFLAHLIQGLIDERGFSIDELVRDRFRLLKAVEEKVNEHRRAAHKFAFQQLLLPESNTPLMVTPKLCFSFDPESYPYSRLYKGSYKFSKHYYPQVGDLGEGGEEFECAQFIDTLNEMDYWVRNLERRPSHSFWLQTSTDKFYPDFVCLLKDGRYMVVEYKGAHLWENEDSKEKRNIGELWERRSDGRCLFIMPKGPDLASIGSKAR